MWIVALTIYIYVERQNERGKNIISIWNTITLFEWTGNTHTHTETNNTRMLVIPFISISKCMCAWVFISYFRSNFFFVILDNNDYYADWLTENCVHPVVLYSLLYYYFFFGQWLEFQVFLFYKIPMILKNRWWWWWWRCFLDFGIQVCVCVWALYFIWFRFFFVLCYIYIFY